MVKLTIDDLDLKGKRVLVRVDFNVPLDEKQNITDDTRIKATLPTIKYVIEHGGKAILMSHLGRPKGRRNRKFSLAPVARRLTELLGKEVIFIDDCVGKKVRKRVGQMAPGNVVLLENLRFHPEEERNEWNFSRELSLLGDVYVNDAFGTSHRMHASVVGQPQHIKQAAAGFLLQKEIKYLSQALADPERPFVAILGGAKISTKIGVIHNLLDKADTILIGGAMSYTFLKTEGFPVGSSEVEQEKLGLAASLLKKAKKKGKELMLPLDHLVVNEEEGRSDLKVVDRSCVEKGWIGVDIGPLTIDAYGKKIASAKTIVWNGPMGIYEIAAFAKGTEEIAKRVVDSGALSIIGGGSTIGVINDLGLADKVTHLSTGGGATLQVLAGKELPGISELSEKK